LWLLKGIVHFEIHFWYVLAYLKGIQDVGVFVSTAFSILIFLGLTVHVCQSYNDVTVITRGKNNINTVRFLTETAHFMS